MAWSKRDVRASRATKMTLTGVLLGSMLLFGRRSGRNSPLYNLRPFDLILLGLSSYRTGRIIAFERVAEPIRDPFTETVPDDSGFGETVVAKGRGVRWAFGELMSCPICLATWVAAGLLYALDLIPRPARIYVGVMSIAGVAEIVYGLSETLSWSGHARRAEAGARLADRESEHRRAA
ncbi:MAG: DUF1360 domain-containing protein [Dehalococcoidales bacterium]|nr:DUF1360 domain-containing protein [Dehalococcoidales bacterium]